MWIAVVALLPLACCIQVRMLKQNIFVPNGGDYQFDLNIKESNQQLNLFSCMELNHSITNSLTSIGQYFDYFSYLSAPELNCYDTAVNNSAYLFPCSFLAADQQGIRTTEGQDYKNLTALRSLNFDKFHFVVDNSPFPFPQGAFPYSNISVSSSTVLEVSIEGSYQQTGIRLIFINSTIILIYATIVICLYCRIQRITSIMDSKNDGNEELKQRVSDLSRDIDEESDVDNYDQIIHNELSMRDSQDGRLPSLMSSYHPPTASPATKSLQ